MTDCRLLNIIDGLSVMSLVAGKQRPTGGVWVQSKGDIFGIRANGDAMSDARIEAFLADALALEGEDPDAIREGVHIALADCEQIFKAQEANRRMKDKAAQACHALCRARVIEEIQHRKSTATAEHLKFVLSVVDGPRFLAKER
jgi:hypothetical protein